jgi:hypothetical protein
MHRLNYKPDRYGRTPVQGIVRVFDGRNRQRGQENPLPFHLQVRRQRAKPVATKHGPVISGSGGWLIYFSEHFKDGHTWRFGLRRKHHRYRVEHIDRVLGYMPDILMGVGWVNAANMCFRPSKFTLIDEDITREIIRSTTM